MRLVKWNPFCELEDRFNEIFGQSAASAVVGHDMMKLADWIPSVVSAEMPEVKKEDVKVNNGMITRQSERKVE